VTDVLRILAVLVLIGGNAFFVIGEYAVVTARRAALLPRAEAGSAGARAALRLMDDPVRVISTVQVGITAIGILTGALGEPLVRDLLGDGIPPWLSFVLAFAVVTYLSVVLGELVPKALTLERAEALAVLVAPPIAAIAKAFRPLVWALQGSAALILRPFGVSEVTAGETIRSADELRALVDEAEGSGVIPAVQEEMLHNVFDFADREAGDVMVPAGDVSWRWQAGAGTTDAARANGQVVNAGAGGRTSLLELLALMETVTGRPIRTEHRPPRTGDVRDSLADLSRAREVLGYVPNVGIREGLERTWAWFLMDAGAAAAR